jgi:serine phosphatase RsbU (regulator of sigma subunit)
MAESSVDKNELDKKSRYLRVINSFAVHLMSCKTVEEVYWSVAKDAIAELGYEDCVIYTFDEDRAYLVQRAAHGPKNPVAMDILNPIKLKPGQGIVGHVAMTGVGEIVNDTRLDSRYVLDDDMRLSEIAVPLIHNGEVIGVIDSENAILGFYPLEDLEILNTIASITASKLIQNQYFDQLTSYKNELEKLVEQRTEHLNATLTEVEHQRALISLKNKDLMDSLLYAKRIQEAVLPSKLRLQSTFSRYFLYDQPRDVVSGDFFWMYESGSTIYVAVADCTGHGVPGALLSLIGYTTLNQILSLKPTISTGELLSTLNERIHDVLNKNAFGAINDGMDISVCRWDTDHQVLQFSGANHSATIIRSDEVIELKGDRNSIGHHTEGQVEFNMLELDLKLGDQIYLFSDGFRDQFGGSKHKKYKLGPFRNLLRTVSQLPFEQRYLAVTHSFEAWKDNSEQTDDVTIFSFEVC